MTEFMGRIAVVVCSGFVGVAVGLCAPSCTSADTFSLTPIDFGDGVRVTGKVATDGTVGVLTEANFLSWQIRVTSTTEFAYSPANTSPSLLGVIAEAEGIAVSTPPDEVTDGGSLAFRGGVRLAAQVADFTPNSLPGGEAFFVNGGNFGYLSLNQANGSTYVAATPRAGASNVFDLIPLKFGDGVTMSGFIATDGTVGPLAGGNLLDWKIIVREVSTLNVFNQHNSRVFAADGVTSDGQTIRVANPDGSWAFAFPPSHIDLTQVQLADFTDANQPGGQALFTNPFAYEVVSPLTLDSQYVTATRQVPEPGGLTLIGTGSLAGFAVSRVTKRVLSFRRL